MSEPLSPGTGVAVWRQIADRIVARIQSGELAPGQPAPSEAELMDRHAVARPTVRQANGWLREHGWIVVHQGRRSVVAERKTAAPERVPVRPPVAASSPPPDPADRKTHPYRPQSGNPLRCEECGVAKGHHR